MQGPDRQARERDVLVLRSAGVSQRDVAAILGMSLRKVLEIEGWIRNLPEGRAKIFCRESAITRTVERLLTEESGKSLDDRQRQRLEGISSEDVLGHYNKAGSQAMLRNLELGSRYGRQLRYLPPLDVILPPLRRGTHRLTIVDQTNWYLHRDADATVRMINLANPGLDGDGAAFHVRITLDGDPLLVCPAEEDPDFEDLLDQIGMEARKHVLRRRQLGTKFLKASREALAAIEDDSTRRTDSRYKELLLAAVRYGPSIPFIPKPPLPERVLEPDFFHTAFQFAVLGQMPDDSRYRVRQSTKEGPFSHLWLGEALLACGLHSDIEGFRVTHQRIITDWDTSPMINNLRQTHNELVQVYHWLISALDNSGAQESSY